MSAYYNENDKFAAAWLRELIKAKLIADGEVDERSITDVQASDLVGFTQCHFFAGIGGWSYALRLAGWPDDRSVWTGSCPCQPFSTAGAKTGGSDSRDLWPTWYQLIKERRPVVVFGEQVESAIGHGWLDRLCDDMEREDYAVGACILPAISIGADHLRYRVYFAGNSDSCCQSGLLIDAKTSRMPRSHSDSRDVVQTNGVSRDVVAFSGFGNAIVPQVAAEFIKAYLAATDCEARSSAGEDEAWFGIE